jgi:general stress protein 26
VPAKKAPESTRPHIPGYGLPKSRKGILPWKWAEDRLKKSHNYWITTVKPDRSPHTMVVWGLWLDRRFLFSTGRQSRKARNLAENNHCIVCSENAAEAVVVEGTAYELKDASIRQEFLKIYEKKYKYDMSSFADEPIYVLSPVVAFGLYEKKFQTAATRWQFAEERKNK